jgi:hypothetical protein
MVSRRDICTDAFRPLTSSAFMKIRNHAKAILRASCTRFSSLLARAATAKTTSELAMGGKGRRCSRAVGRHQKRDASGRASSGGHSYREPSGALVFHLVSRGPAARRLHTPIRTRTPRSNCRGDGRGEQQVAYAVHKRGAGESAFTAGAIWIQITKSHLTASRLCQAMPM